MTADLFGHQIDQGAIFSPCRAYRYQLYRRWSSGPSLVFVMLNPSTADAETNDPTVERCQRRARRLGFSGVVIANLFAFRATDRTVLSRVHDPIGPENDQAIRDAVSHHADVVCAWGTEGRLMGRDRAVLELLRVANVRRLCLGTNADGTPIHPLYLGYDVPLRELP